MTSLAAVIASLLVAAPPTPVRVAGLSPVYCPKEPVLRMRVKNLASVQLLASIGVERLAASGTWEEYSSDVLGTKPYPMQVYALRLPAAASQPVEWRPASSSNVPGGLREGDYRLIATVVDERQPPAQRHVVARFAVRPSSRCGPVPP